jgi:hypothetical protein
VRYFMARLRRDGARAARAAAEPALTEHRRGAARRRASPGRRRRCRPLSEADIDFYAGEFKRSGFAAVSIIIATSTATGVTAAFVDVKVIIPALCRWRPRHGESAGRLLANLGSSVPACVTSRCSRLRHWTSRAPGEVSAAIIDFVRGRTDDD